MGLIQDGQQYLARVAIKKVIYGIAKGAVGVLTYAKATAIQQKLGITVDPKVFQDGLAAFMLAGVAFVHDWAKVHYPQLADWL